MNILPVLDLLDGHVVRGFAGQRSEYRPMISRLTNGSDPLDVARAFRDSFGFHQFYVADLDGILRQRPHLELYRRLIDEGFQLLVDAGIRRPIDATTVCETGVTRIVVGLETCSSPDALKTILECSHHVTFSLDLLHGIPQRPPDAEGWGNRPDEIVRQVVQSNVKSIIVLDLSDVGTRTGGSTDSICRFVKSEFPNLHLIAGGGVRDRSDLNRLRMIGVDEVLVASALHDGRLVPDDFDGI